VPTAAHRVGVVLGALLCASAAYAQPLMQEIERIALPLGQAIELPAERYVDQLLKRCDDQLKRNQQECRTRINRIVELSNEVRALISTISLEAATVAEQKANAAIISDIGMKVRLIEARLRTWNNFPFPRD
jgi:hypothetical protein